MSRFKESKSYKLAKFFGGDPDRYSSEEQGILLSAEMATDVSMSMATGTLPNWVSLVRLYDEEKSLSNQSLEFQRQAAIIAAGSSGMMAVAGATGMSSIEFAVGRRMATRTILAPVMNPLVGVPVLAILATEKYPRVAGPQYQSAMTGQPSIGGSILSKRTASSWKELFSAEYWGIV